MDDTLNTPKVIICSNTLELKQVTRVLESLPGFKYLLITLPIFTDQYAKHLVTDFKSTDISSEESDSALLRGKADLVIQKVSTLTYPLPLGLEVIALFRPKNSYGSDLNGSNPESTENLSNTHSISLQIPEEEHFAVVALVNRPDLKLFFEAIDIRYQFGKITLVGFGPGNPDLLTIGGDKALKEADIIYHDDLLDKEYIKRYTAQKVYVGKRRGNHCIEQDEINRLILKAAREGKQVVRLKGGDPMIFAHGGEEIEYLERNLMAVEVIPGVSSGIAVASILKIPLTHRGISSSVAFISGHSEKVHLPDTDTLIIYMGGSNIRAIARKAIEEGRKAEIPVMLVYNLSLPGQQEFFFTLDELTRSEQKFPTPVIIVIGEVVAFRNKSNVESLRKEGLVRADKSFRFYDLAHEPNKLKAFDWLIFTNRKSVHLFFGEFEKSGKDFRFLAGLKIATSGKNTDKVLRQYGLIADLIADSDSSDEQLTRFSEAGVLLSKVLVIGPVRGWSELQQKITEPGWEIIQLVRGQNLLPVDFSTLDVPSMTKPQFHRHTVIQHSTITK